MQTSKHKTKSFYCDRCLNPFTSQAVLDKHLEWCSQHDAVNQTCLKKVQKVPFWIFLDFKNHYKSMRVYADMEAFPVLMDTCSPNSNQSYTKQYQKHEPCSYRYYIKSFDENVYKSKMHHFTKQCESDDIAQRLVQSFEKDVKELYIHCLLYTSPSPRD